MFAEAERTVVIIGMTLREVRKVLRNLAYREQDPVMLVLFSDPGCVAGALKYMRTVNGGKRLPDELRPGAFRAVLHLDGSVGGVRITFQRNRFFDSELFWRTVDELVTKLDGEVKK